MIRDTNSKDLVRLINFFAMETIIFEGNKHMRNLRDSLRDDFSHFSIKPELHIIIVGFHPVIERFVRMKKKFGEYIDITVKVHRLDVKSTTEVCQEYITSLVEMDIPMGIIVQLPLPEQIDIQAVLDTVPARCDVDVLGSQAQALFAAGDNPMIPTVARAIGYALDTRETLSLSTDMVIVGNGKLVGAPTALYMRQKGYAPWVFDKESDPETYAKALKDAEVIISGVGYPGLITADQISQGVNLIDAGTSEGEGVLKGDIDPSCYEKALWYTPTPGGVGPLTVAMIFTNLYDGYKDQLHDVS